MHHHAHSPPTRQRNSRIVWALILAANMESSSSRSSYDYRESSGEYSDSRSEHSSEDELKESTDHFYVTKESQETQPDRKCSYVGMRDLSDLDKIQEQDIVAPDGTVLGVRNRVRAGTAHFEDREALEKASRCCTLPKGGGAALAVCCCVLLLCFVFVRRKPKKKVG